MDDVIIDANLNTYRLIQDLLRVIGSDVIVKLNDDKLQTSTIGLYLYGKKYIINKI